MLSTVSVARATSLLSSIERPTPLNAVEARLMVELVNFLTRKGSQEGAAKG